jgi:hypothetical protein
MHVGLQSTVERTIQCLGIPASRNRSIFSFIIVITTMTSKLGPDDPCPCKSGKVLRLCHGTVDTYRAEVGQKLRPGFLRFQQMQSELGPLRLTSSPQVEFEAWGKKIRAVRSKLIVSPKEEPFHQFLINVLFDVLGKDWYEEQLKKPLSDSHVDSEARSSRPELGSWYQ